MALIASLLSISASLSLSSPSHDNSLNAIDRCSSLIGSCEYYSCVEEERLSCGDRGYPIGYGVNYCEKLSALEFSPTGGLIKSLVFPGDGNEWRDNVRECLQEEMDEYFRTEENVSCDSLRKFAFNSHPRCYTQTAVSFCELSPESVVRVGATIAVKDLLTEESLRQVRDTANICEEQLSKRLESEGNLFVRLELQKYRLIWQSVAKNPLLLGSLPKD